MQEISKHTRRNQPEQAKPSEAEAPIPGPSAVPEAAAAQATGEPVEQGNQPSSEPPANTPDAKTSSVPDSSQAQDAKTSKTSPSSKEALMAVFSGVSDKVKRTELHAFFRRDLSLPKLVTDTIKHDDGAVDIRVMAQTDLKASVRKCGPDPASPAQVRATATN